ncbi:pyridoxamine 5'-phosphate oxidase-like FMN-binding protein [Nitzschia inconspicua]|uniref:Pyridoxamine 5'-phosphate oxidase-like FMN-binding protein n=1 Tax=Nitzschia inconspicua TaxID=303405 RepID=A0A9K3LWX0_9STRA|nr:pyridoxamine 5'-phosphate oxidase-like FMN-binding protein [Nitzschia inconspicua]
MGKLLEKISEKEENFIGKQKVFFVATAPSSGDHHVNVSPKAPGTSVVVIDPHTVAYADLTGSGSETASHVMENGRMTLMFCNIEAGPPQILRLHGTARVVIKEEVPASLLNRFPEEITTSFGFRCVYVLNVHRVSSSCGYSLPVMQFEKYRQVLAEYTENKGEEGMKEYSITKNSFSIDGLPSLALLRNKDKTIEPDPQDGYVFGKEILGVDPISSIATVRPYSKRLREKEMIILAVGALIGTTISSLYFQLASKQE